MSDHETHYGRWDEFAASCEECATSFEPLYFVGVTVFGTEEVVQLSFRTQEDPHGWLTYRWREDGEDLQGGQVMVRLEEWFRPLTPEEVVALRPRWPDLDLLLYDEQSFPISLAEGA